MNALGSVVAPQPHMQQLFAGEEYINLCKALNIAVNSMSQVSPLQQTIIGEQQQVTDTAVVPNSGRIVLFTSAKVRNLDDVQAFVASALDECNKNVDKLAKVADKAT